MKQFAIPPKIARSKRFAFWGSLPLKSARVPSRIATPLAATLHPTRPFPPARLGYSMTNPELDEQSAPPIVPGSGGHRAPPDTHSDALLTSHSALAMPGAPPWVAVVGAACGALTLVYMMTLAALLLFVHVAVTPGARFLLIGILAGGMSLASSFLGGYAAANGELPLPFVRDNPVKFSVAGGIATFVIVFILANMVWPIPSSPSNPRTPTEQAVLDTKTLIVKLRGDFEGIPRPEVVLASPAALPIVLQVKDRALGLARDMLAISEDQMDYGHIITKWEYASYAFSIGASLERDSRQRLLLAKQVERTATYALSLTSWVRDRAAAGSQYYRSLMDFFETNSEESRLHYLDAVGLAVECQTPGGSVTSEQVRNEVAMINQSFLTASSLAWNPWVSKVLSGEAGAL